ncbi:hypothetical protein F2Q69_00013204 [Brassica cretica]|uniref:Uncharacterized protein n=1 Tax=Brassica cretica TaxID=69181 RepID=A0A8S9R9A2_BRACR|nr:hypothetical protein F2Q69_00013204 [Brassica cretica]
MLSLTHILPGACHHVLNTHTSSHLELLGQLSDIGLPIARVIKEEVKKELRKSLEEAQLYMHTVAGPKLALVIDGKCLMYALDPSLRVTLLSLSLNCTSVVCCRVSPLQKAQVTSLVRKGAKKITLVRGNVNTETFSCYYLKSCLSSLYSSHSDKSISNRSGRSVPCFTVHTACTSVLAFVSERWEHVTAWA